MGNLIKRLRKGEDCSMNTETTTPEGDAISRALQRAYLAGFNAAGEGYNGEYPFSDSGRCPTSDEDWIIGRDMVIEKLSAALRAHPAPVGGETEGPTIEALTKSQTFWYSSNDEECWQGGPYDTREEAEGKAKASEHRLIVEATKTPIRVSLCFDEASFIEQAEESLYDRANEDGDPLLDFLPAVNLDLQARVRAAIDDWQVAHQLAPVAWRFDSTGPVETASWALPAHPISTDHDGGEVKG